VQSVLWHAYAAAYITDEAPNVHFELAADLVTACFLDGALKAVPCVVDNRLMLLLSRLDCALKHIRLFAMACDSCYSFRFEILCNEVHQQ
jgi:hypothetical protein